MQRVTAIARRFAQQRGALLPILHAVNEELGCVDDAAVQAIAQELNLSLADVHGVVSFYHDFRRERHGRHILKVCRGEACQAMDGEALLDHIRQHLTSLPADAFTIEPVFCLGNCALAPSVSLDGEPRGRMTPARIDKLLREAGE